MSGRFDLARRRLAVITPVAPHPTNGNGVIVADLSFEDDRWLQAPPEALREALFARGFEGPRPPLKVVSLNKVPALAPYPYFAARIDSASILISIGSTRCGSALLGSKG